MSEHTVTLIGSHRQGKRPAPEIVGPILTRIEPAIKDTIRMGFLHSSRKKGRPWRAMERTWDIRFVGIGEGRDKSTCLHFEAPSLEEAAPEIFQQEAFFPESLNPNDTGFDMFGSLIDDIANKRQDSERYDIYLLKRVQHFSSQLKTGSNKGLEGIEIAGHNIPTDNLPVINMKLIETALSLTLLTPSPKRVRLQGKLDMIRVSDRVFEILLKDGTRLKSVWMGNGVVELGEFLDKEILMEGIAVFRPSGSLLRVDAEAIAPSTPKDEFFSVMPQPDVQISQFEKHLEIHRLKSGFKAIFGKWPGDESEEEITKLLMEID